MPSKKPVAAMSAAELQSYYREITDDLSGLGRSTTIEHFDGQRLRSKVELGDQYGRPGGTVSGPTLFSLVDSAGWMMAVARHGHGSDAFTTDVSMHFLHGVPLGTVIVEAAVLKRGSRDVFEVDIAPGPDGPAVHAIITFASRPGPSAGS